MKPRKNVPSSRGRGLGPCGRGLGPGRGVGRGTSRGRGLGPCGRGLGRGKK